MAGLHETIERIFQGFDERDKTIATMNFVFALEKLPATSKEIFKKALIILNYFFEKGLELSLEMKEGQVRFRDPKIELIYEEIHSPSINIFTILKEFKTCLALVVKEPSLLEAMNKRVDQVYKDFYLKSRLPKEF